MPYVTQCTACYGRGGWQGRTCAMCGGAGHVAPYRKAPTRYDMPAGVIQ